MVSITSLRVRRFFSSPIQVCKLAGLFSVIHTLVHFIDTGWFIYFAPFSIPFITYELHGKFFSYSRHILWNEFPYLCFANIVKVGSQSAKFVTPEFSVTTQSVNSNVHWWIFKSLVRSQVVSRADKFQFALLEPWASSNNEQISIELKINMYSASDGSVQLQTGYLFW